MEYLQQQSLSRHEKHHQHLNHLYKRIDVEDPKKGIVLTHTEKVARFSKEILSALLLQQGLTIKSVWGDYQLNSFDAGQSPRMIFYAQREN